MLSIEEQNIIDILEDSELDFKWNWKKSRLSSSLFVRVNLIDNNLSNVLIGDLVKNVKEEYERHGTSENVIKDMNINNQTILRIKKLTGHHLESYVLSPNYDIYNLKDQGGHIDLYFSREISRIKNRR